MIESRFLIVLAPLNLKKVKTSKYIWLLCAICGISCVNDIHEKPEINCVTLDAFVSKEHPSISNDFTDFEIIPLENKKEGIITEVRKMVVTDDDMYFWDAGPKPQVLRFSLSGIYKNNIGRRGHANGEYNLIMNIAGTQNGDTIAVLTYPNAHLYSKSGKFLNSIEIKNDQGTEDILLTDNGIYLGYFHRQTKSLMTFYNKNLNHPIFIVETQCNPFGEPLGVANGHLIQQDDNFIYCLDPFNSCFYVVGKDNPEDITKYSFNMDNMLNEEGVRCGETDRYKTIYSYQAYKGIIRGVLLHEKGNYDFKFSLNDKKVELVNHEDLDFLFDCCHAGYYYKVISPIDLLEIMDSQKKYMDPIRHLLGETLNALEGKISPTDNYYIIKMRIKE